MAQNNSNGTLVIEKTSNPTPEPTEEVRIVPIDEFEEAAQCLSEAFAVDEVARYFVDTDDMSTCTEEYKYKVHCNIIRYLTAAHCYKGLVTTIGPNYDAVALWLPPGQNPDDWWTFFRSGLWRLYYQLSSEGRKRFFDEFFPLLHHTKHAVMGERDDDSYYLVYLGSKPSSRGKGYARKLIECMTAQADLEGRATYLESSAEANLPYYKRFGFDHKMDIQLERGPKPIKLHIMVREPEKMAESSVKVTRTTVSIRAL
ncbi:Acetyltransferase [Venustampulla echinocandica]|uniref:Acetyltransferase n=1 Tax=Venustampulla echinocandica TaxID=2656787 RepID=A0A370TA35_9HELO|nr:Acetyltransferase [Venustampulla echinocandica]RDL30676.1 Acetyltransferase [Venustampulla echinocandica]